MNTRPTATYIAPDVVELVFPYRPELIQAIKAAIPKEWRSYEPGRHAWTVQGGANASRAEALLRSFFPDATVHHPGSSTQRPAARDPYAVLHLRPTAPPQLVDVAYRTLAKLSHPDRGGDQAAMTSINLAYEQLRQEESI
jgi:hypothetical protein